MRLLHSLHVCAKPCVSMCGFVRAGFGACGARWRARRVACCGELRCVCLCGASVAWCVCVWCSSLDLAVNNLGGTIPDFISTLTQLQYVQPNNTRIWLNNFTCCAGGTFHSGRICLGNRPHYHRYLGLSSNVLQGSVPNLGPLLALK